MRSLFIILLFASFGLKAQLIEEPFFYFKEEALIDTNSGTVYRVPSLYRVRPFTIYRSTPGYMQGNYAYIFIGFTLTAQGKIKDIHFTEHTPMRFKQNYISQIMAYESSWTPQKIDGKPVDSKILLIEEICVSAELEQKLPKLSREQQERIRSLLNVTKEHDPDRMEQLAICFPAYKGYFYKDYIVQGCRT